MTVDLGKIINLTLFFFPILISSNEASSQSYSSRDEPPSYPVWITGKDCNFSFENVSVWEFWDGFLQYAYNNSSRDNYRPNIVANVDIDRAVCGVSERSEIHFLEYRGHEKGTEKFVFLVDDGGTKKEYRFDLSVNANKNIQTFTWRDAQPVAPSPKSRDSGSSASNYRPTHEYVIRCEDMRLFGENPKVDVSLGSCTGWESECEAKLYEQIEREFGFYTSFCSKTMGSNEFRTLSIRRK